MHLHRSSQYYYTVDQDIFDGKIFVNFSRSLIFVAQTLAIKICIDRRMLHKIFHVFNFRQKRSSTKYFNN